MADALPAHVESAKAEQHDSGPLPMSFPAVLRTAGLKDRFAHLRFDTDRTLAGAPSPVPPRKRREDREGKRWIRRKENAHFAGNAHIVVPSRKDFSVLPPSARATFPQPLPAYLPRISPVPAAVLPAYDVQTANAGRFSMSLKGMRRELRKAGPLTQQLVHDVEHEILTWLRDGGVFLSPDAVSLLPQDATPIGVTEIVTEVSRTPLQLVWEIADNAHARYVVHCCARYHEVISFSKDTSGRRLTYLLRPNVTRPTRHAPGLVTPPFTDLESSTFEYTTESEFVSDLSDVASDAEGPTQPLAAPTLSSIREGSVPSSPNVAAAAALEPDDSWSVIGEDADVEADVSGDEVEREVASLSLGDGEGDADRTSRAEPRLRQMPLRSQMWERQRRSASSPSRSPARRSRPVPRKELPRSEPEHSRSFYNYLFT